MASSGDSELVGAIVMKGNLLQGRYQLQEKLAEKASRQTWLAEDLASDPPQQCVVKLLPFSPHLQWQDLKLFEREAQVLRQLAHPRIPAYLDSFAMEGEAGSLPCFALVQEYIPGKSLQTWLAEGRRFTEKEGRRIAAQLLDTLIYLHELSPPVLHRDIKPS
ncbi:MAG: protein kinase, partial [Leptolyngbyaceae cyanobacterium bins.59]|nr:protein kinase [Leptolyngbyaceae cyanobacterium bins.59]